MKRLLIIPFTLIMTIAVIAQTNQCPVVERAAVSETRVWCADLVTGEVCYGNSPVTADSLSDVPFATAGDIVSVTELTQIETSIDDSTYGIVRIETTGYLSDSWQSTSASLAILGDVTIANTGNEGINIVTMDAEVFGAQGANIRSGPSPDFRLITSLFEGDLVKLTGRTADSAYYRLQLPSGETGWIASGAIAEDTSELATVTYDDPAPEIIYAPYTSFSLTTGIADAGCADGWESGVLVQSPLDSEMRLRVNDYDVAFSGTLFVIADEVSTIFYVLEGDLAYDAEEMVTEGAFLRITVEGQVTVSPYNFEALDSLPTEILPRYTYIGIDITTIITPAPEIDQSPISNVLVDDPCVITTGNTGANLRAGPGSEFEIRGVLAFRETVNPIGRAIGSDGLVWWELAQNLWISSQVVVTGGDCFSVPESNRIPVPLPTATPES